MSAPAPRKRVAVCLPNLGGGGAERVALEFYLAQRGNGLAVETPAVRP